jgi:thiamine-phosphate pyrophosphorylase
LSAAIVAADVACVLLRTAPGFPDDAVARAIESLRTSARQRDFAILIEERIDLVRRAAADGVHLHRAAVYGEARSRLGADLTVGVTCATRDQAIDVAENGADYVVFGIFDDRAPTEATADFTEWWSDVMTVPCVAAGCTSARDAARMAAAGADFVALGTPAWPSLADILQEITAALAAPGPA